MASDLSGEFDNTVLTLYLPQIPLGTESVKGAHYGVSLHSYNAKPKGLAVQVDPYLGQAAGDTVRLDLNGQPGIDSTQTLDDTTGVTLYIPKGLLLPGRVNQLVYTVIRRSQNLGSSTPALTLLYNAIRPGIEDSTPGDGGHSELELILPDAIKNGVGADFPVDGAEVSVSYPYCRAYDRIWLNCNGHDVYYNVTEDEAPTPPSHGLPVPTTVRFFVTRADLVAGRDHEHFPFSYTVTDQLGNGPDTDSPWSATQTVDVDLAGARLPAAILREILSEAEDLSHFINLEKLGAYLYVIILVRDPRFKVGDLIDATYTGQSPGLPDVVLTVRGNVQADDFGDPVRVVLEIPNDKVISAKTVTVKYVLKRNGEQKYSSREAKAQVIGEAVTVRPVITRVRDSKGEIANGGTTTETSITITGSATAGQKVQLYDGDAPIGGELTAVDGTWTATVSVAVGVRRLTAKALYGSGQVSAAWVVNVTGLLELNPPTVKEAPNNSLDPLVVSAPVQNYVTIIVPKTPPLPPDSQLSVSWTGAPGTQAGGSYTSPATLVSAGLEIRIPNTVVAFNLGLSVTVSYTITRGDGDPIPSQTLTLAVQAIDQKDLPKPIIRQAANNGEGSELNVANLTANAVYHMGTWPLIATGQYVWLILHGKNINDTPYRKVIHQAPGSYVNPQWMTQKFYTRSIALSELKNLKDGSTLTMEFKASFSKDDKQVNFPLRTYTIKSIVLVQPEITSVKNNSTEVGNGTTLNVIGRTDTVVTLTGTATANLKVEIFDKNISTGIIVPVDALGIWSTPVTVKVGMHSFTAIAKYGDYPVSTPRTFNQKALWNFVNGSFQGWVAQGNYVGTLDNNHGGVGSNTSDSRKDWRGMIMACPIQVEAGKTYKFTYQLRFVRTGNANVNGTTVTLHIKDPVKEEAIGSPVGVNYNIIGPVSGSGQYKALATGSVMLKFFNHVAHHYGNDFRFNNITMEEAVAARGLDAPAPETPEVIVDRMETERRERLKKLEEFVGAEMLEERKELEGLDELKRLNALEELAGIAPFDKEKALEALKQQLKV